MIEKGGDATQQQRRVLHLIEHHHDVVGRAPSLRYVADRLCLSPTRVQQHLDALYRQGRLRSPRTDGVLPLYKT